MEKFNVEQHPNIKKKFNALTNAANIDLCGIKVNHKVFGEGIIISVNNVTNCITRNCFDYDIAIQFGSVIKEIQFGYALENEIIEISDMPDNINITEYFDALKVIHTDIEAERQKELDRIAALNAAEEARLAAIREAGTKKKKGKKE